MHRQLGVSQKKTLSKKTLRGIMKTPVGNKFRGHEVTALLKRRVNFALNAQKRKK